jgi:hypothetical protein
MELSVPASGGKSLLSAPRMSAVPESNLSPASKTITEKKHKYMEHPQAGAWTFGSLHEET